MDSLLRMFSDWLSAILVRGDHFESQILFPGRAARRPYRWINRGRNQRIFQTVSRSTYSNTYQNKMINKLLISSRRFQDQDIISPCLGNATEVGYILSLAVNRNYRRNGIASLLLDNLITHLTSKEYSSCKAIFLHVLTTNSPAINFYERKRFRWVNYSIFRVRSPDGRRAIFFNPSCFSRMSLNVFFHRIFEFWLQLKMSEIWRVMDP